MVSTSSFLSLELRADNVAEFDAKKAEILAADWNEADRPVNVAGILTQHFWKAPESFVAEATEGEGGEGDEHEQEQEQETATLTAEEAAAYNTAKGLEEGQEGYVSEGDPKPADFDEVVNG